MSTPSVRSLLLLASIGAASLLTGCVVAPVPGPRYVSYQTQQPAPAVAQAAPEVSYVEQAPPAAYNEVITVSPGVGYVWLPGYYGWVGGRYTWNAGYWGRPPLGFRGWTPGYWNRTARGHVWVGGRWH